MEYNYKLDFYDIQYNKDKSYDANKKELYIRKLNDNYSLVSLGKFLTISI